MVIVGDDCALPPPRGVAGRRGLAGTILVHKVTPAPAYSILILVVELQIVKSSLVIVHG